MNDERAAVSLDTALATIRDFATANGLTGDQLLSVVAGARIAGEALGLVLRVPVMTLHHVIPAEETRDGA